MIRFDYNGRDDVTRVTDPRGLVTQYPRNGLGDATALVSPDTGTATHTYDAAGNLKTRLDSRGALVTYSHDALNRVTSVTYRLAGQPDQTFGWIYDVSNAFSGFGIGRLTTAHFPGGSTHYGYDAQGRLVRSAQAWNDSGIWLHTDHGLDAAGHLTRLTYPSGRVLHIARAGGRPVALSLAPSSTAPAVPLISQITHEPAPGGAAPAATWAWHLDGGGTLPHARHFDAHGRMVRYPLGGAWRDLHHDAADRIVAYTHLDAATGTATPAAAALDQSFAYDELGRLVSVLTSVGRWSFGYDANGNRTQAVLAAGGSTVTRAHTIAADSNRLLAIANPLRQFGHDAAGNTITDQDAARVRQAHYDASGRMVRIDVGTAAGTGSTVYAHDAGGQRIFKSAGATGLPGLPVVPEGGCPPPPGPVPGGTVVNALDPPTCLDNGLDNGVQPATAGGTLYVHDQDGRLLGEYDAASGAPRREYVWLHATPIAVIAYEQATAGNPAPVFFIQTDHLDTPRVVLDRAGRQRWTWIAEPFGHSHPNENPLGLAPLTLNLRMPGQYFDAESGLSYNYFRDYDGSVGRYVQSDPIGLEGGVNTYLYADAAPTMKMDRFGLNPEEWVGQPPPNRSDGNPLGWGCGTSGNDLLVPDGFRRADFVPACRKHDQCYETCGKPKGQCDSDFLKDLRAACAKSGNQAGCRWAARRYHGAMQTDTSRQAYERAQTEGCENCKK